jgi:ankyrin repeat domain-containing protein 50
METSVFEERQNSKVSCGIWLKGALGTGKTTLTSTIIDHMTQLYGDMAQGAFAYYYCSGTANTSLSSSHILRSLLRQLGSTDEGSEILGSWKKEHSEHELTNKEAQLLLSDIIKLKGIAQTTIIIDALDEIDKANFLQLVEVLENVINEGSGLVKVFVSSRPEDHIESALRSWARIQINKELTAPDMEAYIDGRVHKELVLDPNVDASDCEALKKDVNTFLKERAGGM